MYMITPSKFITASAALFFLFALGGCQKNMTVDATSSDGSATARRSIGNADEFEIALGETVIFERKGLELTFTSIRRESRCPSDVVCITEGEAVIALDGLIKGGDELAIDARIPGLAPIPYEANDRLQIGTYTIQLQELSPYPNTSVDSLAVYRAKFRIIE